MCEIATLASIGTMAVGTGLNIKGQLDEGRFREKVAKTNAELADAAAADAVRTGQREAGYATMAASQQIEAARNTYGGGIQGGGVDSDVGTPANAMADRRMMSELDAATIQNNAMRQAWGYKVEAAKASAEGRFANIATANNVGGTILSGGANILATGGSAYARSKVGK